MLNISFVRLYLLVLATTHLVPVKSWNYVIVDSKKLKAELQKIYISSAAKNATFQYDSSGDVAKQNLRTVGTMLNNWGPSYEIAVKAMTATQLANKNYMENYHVERLIALRAVAQEMRTAVDRLLESAMDNGQSMIKDLVERIRCHQISNQLITDFVNLCEACMKITVQADGLLQRRKTVSKMPSYFDDYANKLIRIATHVNSVLESCGK